MPILVRKYGGFARNVANHGDAPLIKEYMADVVAEMNSMKKVNYEKSLAYRYPELASEWHLIKNGTLNPIDISYMSNRKVWWILHYDDPKTGKHFDFEWEATVGSRVHGNGCPFISGHKVYPGFNDLQTNAPELAKEWHPKKNGNLTPFDVTYGSGRKVWWLYSYDDPKTGKHFDFEWEATICSRFKGKGCPFLSGHKVYRGYNDLQTNLPELAKEWHPTKNGSLRPSEVAVNSNKEVWWLYSYDDPITGKHDVFEWKAAICDRVRGNGCPYISKKDGKRKLIDLKTGFPKLSREWHPWKNGSLKPSDVTTGSGQKVWWYLPYDDPITGKHFNFEWEDFIHNRTAGRGCPYLSNEKIWPGYNDLQTHFSELSKEWHPTKNGNLKPSDVSSGSGRKVWWYLPYDDPITGKHFDFEWEDLIYNRTSGRDCPYLNNKKVWRGYNDFQTRFPELAKEWHPTKNGDLKPSDILYNSSRKVWWYLPYDDPITGKHFDFEWEATISNRRKAGGCPFVSGYATWPGFNDLKTKYPEIAKEWHPTKNGSLKPSDIRPNCNKKYWWIKEYKDQKTGQIFVFEWTATPNHRVSGTDCPYLSGRGVYKGFNDLATYYPEVVAQWHPTKNGDKMPSDYTFGSHKKIWWMLPYDDPKTGKHFDFEWEATIKDKVRNGCPFISGKKVYRGYNDLETKQPDLSKEWHPTKNGNLKPSDVTEKSGLKVWWLFPYDDPNTGKHFDFEWRSSINHRVMRGDGCPYLTGKKVWKGFNDMGTLVPEIYEWWDFEKNNRITPSSITRNYEKKIWLICPKCNNKWRSAPVSFQYSLKCPKCKE